MAINVVGIGLTIIYFLGSFAYGSDIPTNASSKAPSNPSPQTLTITNSRVSRNAFSEPQLVARAASSEGHWRVTLQPGSKSGWYTMQLARNGETFHLEQEWSIQTHQYYWSILSKVDDTCVAVLTVAINGKTFSILGIEEICQTLPRGVSLDPWWWGNPLP